jgi:hypothetical protein
MSRLRSQTSRLSFWLFLPLCHRIEHLVGAGRQLCKAQRRVMSVRKSLLCPPPSRYGEGRGGGGREGGRGRRASVASTALAPLQSPNAIDTIATPGPAVAPRRRAVAAAPENPAATAPNARSRETRAAPDAPRPRAITAIEPRSAAAANQRYRRSSPVLTARMSPKVTGTAARSTEARSSSWRCRELGISSCESSV